MLLNLKKNHQKGFTIIEVLIVLAIAGLIMVAVFTAVPSLQRSSRNTDRKNAVSQMLTSAGAYVANNNGTLPSNAATLTSALGDYKPGFYPVANVSYATTAAATAVAAVTAGSAVTATTVTTESVLFATGAVCSGNVATTTGASTRSYVFLFAVEGGAGSTLQCIGS